MPLFLLKIAIRLAIPLASVLVMYLAGEPLPGQSPVRTEITAAACATPAISDEIARSAVLIEEGASDLRRAAASMRWLVTLPAASSKRCGDPGCAG